MDKAKGPLGLTAYDGLFLFLGGMHPYKTSRTLSTFVGR